MSMLVLPAIIPFIPLLAAGLTAGAGITQGILANRREKKNAQLQARQNELDRQNSQFMYEYQRDDARADWERQNAYNHPQQQMQRLKEAGLNPNLVYGKGADNTAASISHGSFTNQTQKAPQLGYGSIEAIGQTTNNAMSAYLHARQIQTQSDQANAAIATQASLQALNDAKTLEALQKVSGMKFDLGLKQQVRDSLVLSYELKNQFTRSQIDRNIADTGRITEATKKLAQDIILDKGKYELMKAKTGREMVLMAADIALKEAQKKALESNTELNVERKTLLEKQATMLAELANKLSVEAEYIPYNSGISAGKTLLDGLFGKEWLPGDKKTSPKGNAGKQPAKKWTPPRR